MADIFFSVPNNINIGKPGIMIIRAATSLPEGGLITQSDEPEVTQDDEFLVTNP